MKIIQYFSHFPCITHAPVSCSINLS
jgi:hypothetical protein